jgi:ATP-dependent RNA helicase DDX18/HAS1
MYKAAREAYISYLNAYTQHPMKEIFNAGLLDLNFVAKSFGLSQAPKVALNISTKARKNADQRSADLHKRDDGHVSNQMRKKLSDAKRQWSH